MSPFRCLFCLGALLFLGSCSLNPHTTQRGALLDDKVTALRVKSALSSAGPAFQGVEVSVTNGVAFLRGSVSSREALSRAEQIARKVHRVTGVQQHVRIQAPSSKPHPGPRQRG